MKGAFNEPSIYLSGEPLRLLSLSTALGLEVMLGGARVVAPGEARGERRELVLPSPLARAQGGEVWSGSLEERGLGKASWRGEKPRRSGPWEQPR